METADSSGLPVAQDNSGEGRRGQWNTTPTGLQQGGVSSSGSIPIATGGVSHLVVAGFGGREGTKNNKDCANVMPKKVAGDYESPSSVFIPRSHLSSRSNSFASSAGLYEEHPPPRSPGVSGGGGAAGGEVDEAAGTVAGGRTSSSCDGGGGGGSFDLSSPVNKNNDNFRQSRSVDDLLRESMLSFHREGPLVNPLERWRSVHAITGLHENSNDNTVHHHSSSMKDKMQFVAEVKGFEYGIFWGYMAEKKCFTKNESVLLKSNIGDDAAPSAFGEREAGGCSSSSSSVETAIDRIRDSLSLYVQSSMTMFSTWIMGFGMPGRVGYTGNYEWHEEITCLPSWSFQRLRQAKNAGLRTVIAVPVAGGVVEFGGSRLHPHNVATVTYVQKVMGTPA